MKTETSKSKSQMGNAKEQQLSSTYLKEFFIECSAKNTQFSLRAFAKKMNITPGGLSQVLAGKKRLSYERAQDIANRLNLDETETEYFLLLVQADSTKAAPLKAQVLEKIGERFPDKAQSHNLTIDQFKLISEWYGIALLETVSQIGSNWPADKLAHYLKISKTEVELMLGRLERLELIEKTPTGFKRISDHVLVSSNVPNDAIRSFYKKTLVKMNESIEEQSPQEKITGAEYFAFDMDDLKKAQEITREYFQKLTALAHRGKKKTEIYQAFVNVYRMNQKINK